MLMFHSSHHTHVGKPWTNGSTWHISAIHNARNARKENSEDNDEVHLGSTLIVNYIFGCKANEIVFTCNGSPKKSGINRRLTKKIIPQCGNIEPSEGDHYRGLTGIAVIVDQSIDSRYSHIEGRLKETRCDEDYHCKHELKMGELNLATTRGQVHRASIIVLLCVQYGKSSPCHDHP